MSAVDQNAIQVRELIHKVVEERPFSDDVLPEGNGSGSTGCSKAENCRSSFCAAAVAAFLPTAGQQGREGFELRTDYVRKC